jgi:hypothetical protein
MSRLAEAWSGGGRLGDGQEQASIDEIVAELDSRKGGSGSLGLGTNMRVNLPSKLEKRLKEAGGAGYNLANETVKDAIFNLAKADISLENESSGGGMASRYEGTDVFGRTQL